MFNATRAMQFGLVITMVVVGAMVEYPNLVESSAPASLDTQQVASRYQLRNRTPNFFGRSKTSTAPTPKAPTPRVVRRG